VDMANSLENAFRCAIKALQPASKEDALLVALHRIFVLANPSWVEISGPEYATRALAQIEEIASAAILQVEHPPVSKLS